jgi:hypothetical protein
MKIVTALGIVFLAISTLPIRAEVPIQLAQAKLCKPCEASGEKCCGLQSSVAGCIQCSIGYGFKNPEAWCRKNQPTCSKR